VDNVDLTCDAGRRVLRPARANGSGKSTTVKLLLGLRILTKGTMRLSPFAAHGQPSAQLVYLPENLISIGI